MDPSTPDQRRTSDSPPPPLFPRLDPYHSPTPLPRHPHLLFPDLFAHRAFFRTLSAADSLLHLAASPAGSPTRLLSPCRSLALCPSASTASSHGLSHSQSTFPPTPPPTTPSRCLLTTAPHVATNLDVLDLSSHLFSSPTPFSPRRCELQYPSSTEISPVLHECDKRTKRMYPAQDLLPSLLDSAKHSPHSSRSLSSRRELTMAGSSERSQEPLRRTTLKLPPRGVPRRPAVARPERSRTRPRRATYAAAPHLQDTDQLIHTNRSPIKDPVKDTNAGLPSSPSTPLTPPSSASRIPFPSSQTSLIALSPLSELSSGEPSPRKRTRPLADECPPLIPFYAPRGDYAPSPPRTRRAGLQKEEAGRIVHARKRRRVNRDADSDSDYELQVEHKWKRVRCEQPDEIAEEEAEVEAHIPSPTYPQRTFSPSVPIHPGLPLFYRRFWPPTSETVAQDTAGATSNAPRSQYDLYTPRWVKGRGPTKVGMCPVCAEPPARGGEGSRVWLSMKFSAFKCYHMQYYHGISPAGTPFSPPTAFRRVARPHAGKHEKRSVEQGRCHRCRAWVNVEGVKDVEVKVPEIFWWKHAAACHQGATAEGERDVFVDT
ncbi:hypothetical protein PHLGIDRAFT_122849 [Phlebiopsis gigantea 11061_1 CR5-6]|uniref:Transcription regulator Rua1 C-terminal domain-containing protein n=1 Tax=Phlebiopsis gigantea (strain 11061_1 CR5-6) TaxID=745531 RepID=A0A0C3NBX8_PHLG1|nr:hypothetical protein PHLGIDRAFT_122849 [Phlebiopsis gigantea 11061_1 CR5-6]